MRLSYRRALGVIAVAASCVACASQPDAPRLEGIDPGRVASQTSTRVTVTGTDFHPIVRGNLAAPDEAEVRTSFVLTLSRDNLDTELTQIEWLTTREIAATVPADLALGLYSLELRDPRGRTTSLPDALEVVDAECTIDADCRASAPCAATATCDAGMCNISAGLLDEDGDGHNPTACGGDDCDDACDVCWTDHPEECDGYDNDCDPGTADGADEANLGAACDGDDVDLCNEGTWECTGTLTCSDTTGDDVEVCDGGVTDEDCDGSVDEADAQNCVTYYLDADRDTHGVAGDSRCLCSPDVAGFYDTTLDDDCDDACDVCWTGHPEICGDGEDNDCDGTADSAPTGWWNAAWQGRLMLAIDETIAGTLPTEYTVSLTLDTQARVSAGTMLASGDDVRVVWDDGSSFVELDRRLVDMDSANTEIWFKTRAAIDGSDGSYAVYFDNPSASAPPAYWSDSMGADTPSAVYLAADDFQEEAEGVAPDGWEGSANYTTILEGSNMVLELDSPNNDADYFFAGDYGWGDIVFSARMRRVAEFSSEYYGTFMRAQSGTGFYTVWFGALDYNTVQVYTMHIQDPWATALSNPIASHGSSNVSSLGTTWHTLETRMLGGDLRFFLDGTEELAYTTTYLTGRVGFCSGYVQGQVRWDDITVRKYVDPEPTVTVSAEESACP